MREILLILIGVFFTLFIKDFILYLKGGFMIKKRESYYVIGNKVIDDDDTNTILVKNVEDDIVQWTCKLAEARKWDDINKCENFIKTYIPLSKAKILQVKTVNKITDVKGVSNEEQID